MMSGMARVSANSPAGAAGYTGISAHPSMHALRPSQAPKFVFAYRHVLFLTTSMETATQEGELCRTSP